jgi:hypothetical protein
MSNPERQKDRLGKSDETTNLDAGSPVKLMDQLNAYILEYERTDMKELTPKIQRLFLQLESASKANSLSYRKKLLKLELIKPE